MCFQVSDNGFSWIFWNCLNVDEIFFGTIEQLVCRKMCCKNFENELSRVKNLFLNFLYKNHMVGR